MIFHRFREPFGLIFPTVWHNFSLLFRHRFFIELLMSFLTTFGRKWGPILWAGASILRPFSRPRFRHRFGRYFWTILGSILVVFLNYFSLFSYNLASFCGFSLNLVLTYFSINFHACLFSFRILFSPLRFFSCVKRRKQLERPWTNLWVSGGL